MLAILSLLVTILFGLIAQLPSEQIDTLIEQQSVQIEMERQENEALLKAIDSLTLTVGQLSDEINLLREQSDDSADFESEQDKLTENNALNEITDTEK